MLTVSLDRFRDGKFRDMGCFRLTGSFPIIFLYKIIGVFHLILLGSIHLKFIHVVLQFLKPLINTERMRPRPPNVLQSHLAMSDFYSSGTITKVLFLTPVVQRGCRAVHIAIYLKPRSVLRPYLTL